MNIDGMGGTYDRTYTPYQSNKNVKYFAGFMENKDGSLTQKTADESGKGFVGNFMDYQEFHKLWMSQNGANKVNFHFGTGVSVDESTEEEPAEEKEMPDEEETKTEIVVKPDGSKVLMITVTVGGQEAVTSVELSKPTKDDIPSKDIAVFRALYTDSGSKYTVYKTQDFDQENPVYKVKIWDAEGNMTERMIDASKIDTINCDTFEMEVYAAHLKETGRGDFKETVLKTAIARAASHLEQKSAASWDYSTKINWVDTVKDIMQSAYGYGGLKGYMEWKNFLSFLE